MFQRLIKFDKITKMKVFNDSVDLIILIPATNLCFVEVDIVAEEVICYNSIVAVSNLTAEMEGEDDE